MTQLLVTEAQHLAHDNQTLDAAWNWLCRARRHHPPNADIWDLRFRWSTQRNEFLAQLQAGTYRLSPMQCVGKLTPRVMWSSADALALKWLELNITARLPVHASCEHLKGHGGGPQSIARLKSLTAGPNAPYRWGCRTDIKGYYANIDKMRLLAQCRPHITDPTHWALLVQYVHYSVDIGGEIHTQKKGSPGGVPSAHSWVPFTSRHSIPILRKSACTMCATWMILCS